LAQIIQISVIPSKIDDKDYHLSLIKNKLNSSYEDIIDTSLRKKSIDARRKVVYNLAYDVYFKGDNIPKKSFKSGCKNVKSSKKIIHIIGSGPAGLFAAISCLQNGIKPIVYERGKDVQSRRRDIAEINKNGIVNSESNYCFGEGGAGTFSDGKLYTRSKKKGSVKNILELLVCYGADENILTDSHPHIGTNKLPKVIQNIREDIINKGGEFHFDSKLTDISILDNKILGITINNQEKIDAKNLILATGHSARNIYYLLREKNIKLEFKAFAIGVRVEHSQKLIDKIQYSKEDRGEFLPPSSYKLVHKTPSRGVYSFCMCPGGIIAPCATKQNEVVSNGWSPSKRNNKTANSGIVTEVTWGDLSEYHSHGAFAGLEFQKSIEQKCWAVSSNSQIMPAQKLKDFLTDTKSVDLPLTSYTPGIISAKLSELFPEFVINALKSGLKNFGKNMKGYITNEAIIHAPESRTSSPIRIPRNNDFQHVEIKGLYPCGEGAGYAGGIISAAIDGLNCVKALSSV